MAETGTILLGVTDGVLADSLRFSLELEGYEAKLCDEHALLPTIAASKGPGCLVLDQDVFVRLADGDHGQGLAGIGVPVVLMVGHKSERMMQRAKAAGVTRVVEKPLLGNVLFDAIRSVLDGAARSGTAFGAS